MAKIWEPQSIEVYRSWCEVILDEASDGLSDWETSFIESIGGQLNNNRQLTQRQAEILERIYSEKTS